MLRRKNNEIQYLPQRTDLSPYRFQRTNTNVSPGLSPMRCRTPTRNAIGNISPFRTEVTENYRDQSPMKFLRNKAINPQSNGFFRNQNINNYQNFNQKYATCNNTNNDISGRRESQYENSYNSKIKNQHQNAQRLAVHQNTKLFSKLVSKLNSQKKKESQIPLKKEKKQNFKNKQAFALEQNFKDVPKLTKLKSHPATLTQPIHEQIKPVQSVVYEQKSNTIYTETCNYMYKQNNIEYHHQKAFQVNHCQKMPLNPINPSNNGLLLNDNNSGKKPANKRQKQKNDEEKQKSMNQKTSKKQYQSSREKINQKQKDIDQKQRNKSRQTNQKTKTNSYNSDKKKNQIYTEQDSGFDDVRIFLDKLRESKSKNYYQNDQKDNVTNISDYKSNINMSLMNMDPFI